AVIVDEVVVVNIVNSSDIRDPRVADVHVPKIAAAHSVPWDERLTKSKRAPAETSAESEAEVRTPARPAKPGDQCGRVVRPLPDRSGSPAPVSARIYPSAIVEGSVSPRLCFNPGPAPGRFPYPAAVVIRRPPWSHSRCPHRAVI